MPAAIKEAPTQRLTQPTNGNPQPSKDFKPRADQYKRDWGYAVRQLEKGTAPEEVEKNIAAFRKDHSNPEQYAKTTVAKVQTYLEVQQQLKSVPPDQNASVNRTDIANLDQNLRQLADLNYARQLLDNHVDVTQIMNSLQTDCGCTPEEARVTAAQAQQQWLAERDLDYAIRAHQRGEGDERILPAIAAYRENQVPDPQGYAKAISAAAIQARDAERVLPAEALSRQHVEIAQRQYGRDLAYAVARLEERSPADVRLEMQERHPQKAIEATSHKLYGQADHSYAVTVVQQAERIRSSGQHVGEHLHMALKVSQNDFARHLHEAVNGRNAGHTRDEIIARISEKDPSREPYAGAIANEADIAREHAREHSIRPELARTALEHSVQHTQPEHTRAVPVGMER